MWTKLIVVVVVAILGVALAGPALLRTVGHWLLLEDELAAADAIFVHSGQFPFRALEGAAVYTETGASEVWISTIKPTVRSRLIDALDIDYPPAEYWRTLVLERRGVPAEAIHILDGQVLNTVDEVQLVIAEMVSRRLHRVILVTSKPHARRVRAIWNRNAPEGIEAIVRWSRSDPFDPDAWWTNTEDGSAVLHEMIALLALWTGSSLRPETDR